MTPSITAYELPHDRGRVPTNDYGIYAFVPRFPKDISLGLADEEISEEQILRNIEAKVLKIGAAYHAVEYKGTINNGVNVGHLRHTLSVTAGWEDPKVASTLVRQCLVLQGTGRAALSNLAEVMRFGVAFGGPLYVGMTADQSFSRRLEQHMAYQTGFGKAIKQAGLSWSDLDFHCLSLDGLQPTVVRALERLVQTILRPTLCRG